MERIKVEFGDKSASVEWDPVQASAPVVAHGLPGISGTQTADYRHRTHILAIQVARALGADIPTPLRDSSPLSLDQYESLVRGNDDWRSIAWSVEELDEAELDWRGL